jgi:hypothetical protein
MIHACDIAMHVSVVVVTSLSSILRSNFVFATRSFCFLLPRPASTSQSISSLAGLQQHARFADSSDPSCAT